MMYSNKLVASIKSNGKILREFTDKVYVPFGTEYSILLKNLNTVRASLNVFVDGTDAGDGSSFVVNAGETFELSRFVKDGNLTQGNRFKFIERTTAVSDYRGVGMEDGLIRVEFVFERPIHRHPALQNIAWDKINFQGSMGNFSKGPDTSYYSSTIGAGNVNSNLARSISIADASAATSVLTTTAQSVTNSIISDVGITVPGSISDQTFKTVAMFPVETETYSMVLHLVGETAVGDLIMDPITVKSKPKCTSCGKQNKATAKFCTECGTSLTIV